MKKISIVLLSLCCVLSCKEANNSVDSAAVSTEKVSQPFLWEAANIYFLLTDRFNNGDSSNDVNFERNKETGLLRGFEGGDIKGITQKIKEGYFTDLGINAIWMTPIVEQIHGDVDEGTGATYGYHGYWTKDWTAIDPNYGTKAELHELVEAAHQRGIRVLLDAVINHTGPVTDKDPVWPNDWVRTEPQCAYDNYENTITCTLVKNLPDIKTESDKAVELPPQLIEKWKSEGRYDEEVAELDAFFERTGHPRAPRFYIMKWLTDYITEFGIDGYRADTVKHVEENIWQEFRVECDYAFSEYKKANPKKVLDDNVFYLVAEVYNYGISSGRYFDFGDKKVDYFDKAFTSSINFEFKWNAAQLSQEALFSKYDSILHTSLKNYSVLNYLSSHDDGSPFDSKREKPFETATKLLLSPGASQVYYGDEIARSLEIEGTIGDATLRSAIDWNEASNKKEVLEHWQKLGKFRNNHPAVGAGTHQMISEKPYVFTRQFTKQDFEDQIVVGLDLDSGEKIIDVSKVYNNGEVLRDAYSNQSLVVEDGKVLINSTYGIVLLEKQ